MRRWWELHVTGKAEYSSIEKSYLSNWCERKSRYFEMRLDETAMDGVP
jgi:hypothetical protein